MSQLFAQASELWSANSLDLSPEHFQLRFDALYDAAESEKDMPALWQLGGAAGDYLRRHPGSIEVPPSLAETLLGEDHLDSRIIGLKLLNRLSFPGSQSARWIDRALISEDEYELMGAIHELGDLLERIEEPVDLENIKVRLSHLSSSPEPCLREGAIRCLEMIDSN